MFVIETLNDTVNDYTCMVIETTFFSVNKLQCKTLFYYQYYTISYCIQKLPYNNRVTNFLIMESITVDILAVRDVHVYPE